MEIGVSNSPNLGNKATPHFLAFLVRIWDTDQRDQPSLTCEETYEEPQQAALKRATAFQSPC